MCVPRIASQNERLGTSTAETLYVLCYQHHTGMRLSSPTVPVAELVYACLEPSCLVRYTALDGYSLDTKDAKTIEEEKPPRVGCPDDGQLMYLAEVNPQNSSFRLWKCPECRRSLTNEDSSGGLGKKMGA
jgi:hypothetical protein